MTRMKDQLLISIMHQKIVKELTISTNLEPKEVKALADRIIRIIADASKEIN